MDTIVKYLADPHTFDNLDAIALRATSSILLLAGLGRWLLMDGKLTLKQRRRAKEELLRQKERMNAYHATPKHAEQHHHTAIH